MEFIVYDNIYTYNKHQPFNGVPTTRLVCDSIDIPENHSFWYHTNMKMQQNNLNLNKRYVHIHEGVGTSNKTNFKSEPFHAGRGDIKYNPKEKRVEIGGGFLKKPVFAKKCIYYGTELPSKKMNVVGEWYYNFGIDTMIFILDYNPQKLKFHWEDNPDDPSRAEQLNKIEELEYEIAQKEYEIKVKAKTNEVSTIDQRSFGRVFDL